MCGFTGLYTAREDVRRDLGPAVGRMAATLNHRGPDDGGLWADPERGVGFGFRRLSILDLSPLGHQPMASPSGRYTVMHNGEIYNYREVRGTLEGLGYRFRGNSDTEVAAAAFEEWGVERAVTRFVGMFANAVWDAETGSLTLVRDRMGIKPLFVYHEPGYLSFGSELKALIAGPRFDRSIDRDAVADYLRFLYFPAPSTVFRRVRKLPPGHLLTISDPSGPLPESRAWWSAEDQALHGAAAPLDLSADEAAEELETLLSDAVRMRTVADVPLGAFLSGGIDSSTVVALLCRESTSAVRTFSVAFDVEEHNEAESAAAVARHLDCDHRELHVSAREALDVVPRLPDIYDEPFADPSGIPTYLISSLAREHVTVALSGDGGDELFGGYNRHTLGAGLFPRLLRVPPAARRLAAAGIGAGSASAWGEANRVIQPLVPQAYRQRLAGVKIRKFGDLLSCDSSEQMYRSLVSVWRDPDRLVEGGAGRDRSLETAFGRPELDLLGRMLLCDQTGSLADDQLTKVDRASMAASLEVRVPILDHRIVEWSWRLPSDLKVSERLGKRVLRDVLYRHVDRPLVDRPKVGFSVPLAEWLRGPLATWAEDLLAEDTLASGDVLRPTPVREAWSAFRSGRDELALGLWGVLVFQAWQQRWIA